MKTLNRRVPSSNPFRTLFSYRGFLISPVSMDRMKRGWPYIAVFMLYLALTISAAAQDNRGILVSSERLALVIGNNAYQSAPLRNPVNDAEDMSSVLVGLGFNVTLKKNVDRRTLEDSIRQFGRQLRNGGVGLFYFAGHGMQVEGRNYLIPIHARIESESDAKYEAVDAGFVLSKMEDAKNQLNIMILDACRSNPFSRNFRASEKGLSRMDAPTGSLIVYATAPGEVSADGPERNGIFTKHLIRHMQTPNLPVEQVLKRVRIDVASETNQRQIPWESSSLMGDFYFKMGMASEATMHPPAQQSEKTAVPSPASMAKTDAAKGIDLRPQISMAILPFHVEHRSQVSLGISGVEKEIINRLMDFLNTHRNFSIKYSFYPFDGYQKSGSLFETLSEKEKSNLWKNKKIFSSFFESPDFNVLCDVGNRLSSDVILTYRYLYETSGVYFGAYLLDVKNKKLIEKVLSNKETTSGGGEIAYLSLAFNEATSSVIKKYLGQ